MNTCDPHDIAFNSRHCPACDAEEEIENLQKEIEKLNEKLSEEN